MKTLLLRNPIVSNSAQIFLSCLTNSLSEAEGIDIFLRGIHLNSSYFISDKSIHLEAIDDLISTGATLRICRLERYFSSFRFVSRCIEERLGTAVWLNAYLSTIDSVGLGQHTDDHSVTAFQLAGGKGWSISISETMELAEYDIQESTWVHIPRNVAHQAKTELPLSLHIALGCNKELDTKEISFLVAEMQQCIGKFFETEYSRGWVEQRFPKTSRLSSLTNLILGCEFFKIHDKVRKNDDCQRTHGLNVDTENTGTITETLRSNEACFKFEQMLTGGELTVF